MKSLVLFVLWTAVVYVSAVPVTNPESGQCAGHCSPITKYKYSPGTTYIFDYSATTKTEVKGASEESAQLKIGARAEIEVFSTCEFGLSLTNVQLWHSDGNGRLKNSDREYSFKQTLEKSVLRFGFHDGVVGNVCPSSEEPAWALNIKRGVLSVFQNGISDWNQDENRTETDLAGVCPTAYTVHSAGYFTFTTVVRRSKDILSCTQRHDVQAIYHMAAYDIQTDLQSLPIMKTTHECEYSIKTKGLLSEGTCTEVHVYRPFSNGISGGSTTVHQALTFYGERRGVKTRIGDVAKRTNLLFEHIAKTIDPERAVEMMEVKLEELCSTTEEDIRPETPRMFNELVSIVRYLNHQDLETVYRRLKTNVICDQKPRGMKFFMDALPLSPTAPSIRVMSTLISNDQVQGLKARTWLTALAFIPQPTVDMLREVMTLLYNAKSRDDALLPVSSMVYNFCKNRRATSGDCTDVPEIDAVVASMLEGHSRYCDSRGDKLGKTLLLLRSLGNAGYPTKALDAITGCLTSRYSSLEVKVAATQAYRRMPCSVDNTKLWSTLQDKTADSELRIGAYLSLMRCPDEGNLQRLAAILNAEEKGHVGSFMYSHMTNLQESSNPHNQDVAKLISRLKLEKEFSSNPVDTSINVEKSVIINKLNTGFTSDSNIIWSDQTKHPHSVSTNFSVELFGNSINILDIGARLDGQKFLARAIVYGSKANAHPTSTFQISMYGRMFGNEVMFRHVQANNIPFPFENADKWMDALIKMADDQRLEYTQSVNFLDSGMVIPTAAGFPLTMSVNGTAVVDVTMSGKMDLRKLAAKPRSLTVDGQISPSAAIEMNGVMVVDAYGSAQAALRMRNVMHTSTSIKGRVHLDRGQQFSMDLDVPKEKMEVFEARSEFIVGHNKQEKPLDMITDNRKEAKFTSGPMMSKVTGMELVGEVSFPNASMQSDGPYFPMTGPASVKIVLNKKDSHSGYKLFVKRVENRRSSTAQILFNTPGSQTDRKMLLDIALDFPQKQLEMKAVSPWKKATFKGNMIDTETLKSLSGDLLIDDSSNYGLVSEVKIADDQSSTTFTPKLELRRPGKKSILLSGIVNYDHDYKGVDSAMTLSGIKTEPYLFNGKVTNTNKEKSLSLSFTPPNSKKDYAFETKNTFTDLGNRGLTLNSKLDVRTPVRSLATAAVSFDHRKDKMLNVDSSMEIYRLLRKSTLAVSISKVTKKALSRYNHDIRLKSPKLSGRIQGQTSVKGFKLVASKITLDYTIPRQYQNKVLMNLKYSDRSTSAYSKYNLKSAVDFKNTPEYNVGLDAAVDFKKRIASSVMEVTYGADPKDRSKRITVNTSLKKNIRNWKNAIVGYKMKAVAPEFDIDVDFDGKHTHTPKMLDSSLKMNYAGGKTMSMGVNLKDQSSKRRKMNGQTFIQIPGHQYTLSSSYVETTPTQTTHFISLTDKRGNKNEISTIFNTPKNKPNTFVSSIKLGGLKQITASGSANLDPKNFKMNGELKYAKDVYSMATNGKYAPNLNRGKLAVEMQYPSRKMTMSLDGGFGNGDKNGVDGNLEIDWDANRKKIKSQMSLMFNYLNKKSADARSLSTTFQVKTPFKKFENIGSAFKYLSDDSKSDVKVRVTPGSKANEIATSVNVVFPFNIYSAVATVSAKTPFRGLGQIEANINHKLDTSLTSALDTMLEQYKAEILLTGENKGDRYKTDLEGKLAFKSNLPDIGSVNIAVSHQGDSRKYKTSSTLTQNRNKYTCDMNVDHYRRGWNVRNKGDIDITTPAHKWSTVWTHENSENSVKSSLMSRLDGKSIDANLNGVLGYGATKTIDGSLVVQSSWKDMRDANLKLSGKYGTGLFTNKVEWNRNGGVEASSLVNLLQRGDSANFDAMVTSPFYDDLSAKMSVDYSGYPATGSAMVEWSPRKKISVTGSAVLKSWDNTDLDIKVTTPFSMYRNVVWKASSKVDNSENVLMTNVDTGVRQWMNAETRFRLDDDVKMAKLKLKSSHENLKSVETGIRLEGDMSHFDAKAEFEAEPYVDKMSVMVVMKNQDKFSTDLYIFTPFPEMPSFEASLTYENVASQHASKLRIEYPNKITGTLEMTAKTDLPLNFVAKVTSDNPEYNNIGFSLQHGHSDKKINSHVELSYKPGQKMEADVIGSWLFDSRRASGILPFFLSNAEGSVMIKTPYRNYRLSKAALRHTWEIGSLSSHVEYNIGKHQMEVDGSYKLGYISSGSFAITSTVPEVEKVRWTFKKRGNIRNMRLESLWERNKEMASVVITNRYARKSLTSSALLTSSYYSQPLKLMIKHKENPDSSYEEKVTASYGRGYTLEGEAGFSMKGSVITGNTNINIKQERKRDSAGLSFSKSGPIDNFNIEATGRRNNDVINVKGSWMNGDDIAANLGVKTPFVNYQDLNMRLSHKGILSDFETESSLTYMDDQIVFGKIKFVHGEGKFTNIVSEITTPMPGYESASFKLLQKNNLFDQRATKTSIDGSVELTTAINGFGQSLLKFKVDGTLDNFDAELDAMKNRDQLFNIKTVTYSYARSKSFKTTTEIKGSLTKEVTFMFETLGTPEDLINPRSSGNFKLSVLGIVDRKPVAVTADIAKRGTISRGNLETTVEIVTPIPGYASTKFNYKHTGQSNGFKGFSTLEYGYAQKIEYELQALTYPTPKYVIKVKTPYTDYKEMKSDVEYDITGPSYSITGDVNAGNGYIFTMSGGLETAKEISGNIFLTTPFRDFNDLSATFSHKGDELNFKTDAKLVYMNRKNIAGNIQFNRDRRWNGVDLVAEVTTPFQGMQKSRLVVQNNMNKGRNAESQMTSTATIDYGTGQKIQANMQMKIDPTFDLKLDIKTPYSAYRSVKINSKAEGLSTKSFKGMGSVSINRYDTYTSSIDWNVKSVKDMSGFINVYTPIQGRKQIAYSHDISDRNIDGKASVEYDNGKAIRGELKTTLEPNAKELTVSVKSPFNGYEDLSGAFMYSNNPANGNRMTENTIDLGQGRVYHLKSAVDYSSRVFKIVTALRTPIEALKEIDFQVMHDGPWEDFSTYSSFNSPQTDKMESWTTVSYKGVLDTSISTQLKSSLEGMEDVKLDLKTSDVAGERKMTTALQWAEGKTIMSNVLYRQQSNRWNGDKYHTDFTLTTPFDQIRSLSVQLDQVIKSMAYETKIRTQLNGDQLLDMDLNLSNENDMPSMEATVRQPRPMQMRAKTSEQRYKREAEIYVNWDRDDAESNINIQGSRSLTRSEEGYLLEVTHPSRTVGLSHKRLSARGVEKYEGKMYWNTGDDSRLMYTLETKDIGASSSRRRSGRTVREGAMTLGIPGRTLSLVGTYSGQGTTHGLDTTLSWDVDNDTSKKMEVKATLSGDRPRKGEMVISLPSMNKEMKFEGELTTNNGRTIWDARTDISYSQDARKTLTLTSKVEDIKDYRSDFNYSVSLGVSHPYTRVDVQMTSHLGHSRERSSLGTRTSYLTARKQMKNMELFAEINRIKKTLNVMMTNPMHSMSMSGGVVSERPYKVLMENRMDQATLMKWDLTLDSDKKAALLNTYYNKDGRVRLSAMYPNSTTVLADVARLSPMEYAKEMAIGVSLVNPRLIHASLQWRPGMVVEMSRYAVAKFRSVSNDMLMKWKNVHSEIIDEVAAKHSAIVNAMSEEIKPVLEDLNTQLKTFDQQISNLLRSMELFYRENELYDKAGEIGKDAYLKLRDSISQFGRDYKRWYTEWMTSSFETLDEWKTYDLKATLLASLEKAHRRQKDFVYEMAENWDERIDNMDDTIEEMEERTNEIMEQVRSNPYVKEISNRVRQIQDMDVDLTPYVPDVDLAYYPRAVADWTMVSMPDIDLTPLTSRPEIKYVHRGANEVYQQGVWAYKYWDVKENLKKHAKTFLQHAKIVAKDELKGHMQIVTSFSRNPVTVWLPEKGLVEMDIPLPLPVHRLDEMPEWGEYFDGMSDVDFTMVTDIMKGIKEYAEERLSSLSSSLLSSSSSSSPSTSSSSSSSSSNTTGTERQRASGNMSPPNRTPPRYSSYRRRGGSSRNYPRRYRGSNRQ